MSRMVYMDYNATTPVDPRVLDAMLPYYREHFGNAASRSHRFGWVAEEAVEGRNIRDESGRIVEHIDGARDWVARAIGATAKEIIWTSGATESNNLAIKGVAAMYRNRGNHIVTQVTEHKAVIDPCKWLETQGFRVTYLPVDQVGRVHPEQVREAIDDQTILVTIMMANNEIGTIQPVEEIGRICKERGVLFHTDATQAFGKLPIDVEAMGIDLLSCSGHKIYGPKGVGALYVRRKNPRVRLEPLIHGGGHERGMRSGTLNVPGIVGFGKAAELALAERDEEIPRIRRLRDRLWEGIRSRLDGVTLNGDLSICLPNTLNVSFAYVEGEGLMMSFSDIAVSSGSACTSASLEPSYVLKALGVGEDLAHSSVRFSIGRFTTQEEVDYAIECVVRGVQRLREMSPLYELVQEGIDPATVQWQAH